MKKPIEDMKLSSTYYELYGGDLDLNYLGKRILHRKAYKIDKKSNKLCADFEEYMELDEKHNEPNGS